MSMAARVLEQPALKNVIFAGEEQNITWRRNKKRVSGLLIIVLLASGYTAYYLGRSTYQLQGMESQFERLLKEQTILEARIEDLKRENDYYESMAFVERAAREGLGLIHPGEVVLLPAVEGEVQPLTPPSGEILD